MKANAQVGFDNVALWHERDIWHSSAERVVLADSYIGTDYLLGKLEWTSTGSWSIPSGCAPTSSLRAAHLLEPRATRAR